MFEKVVKNIDKGLPVVEGGEPIVFGRGHRFFLTRRTGRRPGAPLTVFPTRAYNENVLIEESPVDTGPALLCCGKEKSRAERDGVIKFQNEIASYKQPAI